MSAQDNAQDAVESGHGHIRVLLLEDNAADVELVLRQLRRDDVDVASRTATDEYGFRQALAEFSPQLILSDFSLPTFDGLSALRIARQVAPSVPFIFVSGTIGEERAIDALKNGASDYVLKENLRRLAPAIRGALRTCESSRARELAEEKLRRSESRLQDIINTSIDWIWECDRDWRFTFSSPSIERILGYNPRELMQAPASDFVNRADHGRLLDSFQSAAIDTDTAASVVLRWIHKNGQTRWLERKTVALRDQEGALRGYRGIDRDVTARTLQEERITRLNRAISFLSGANAAIVRIRDRQELLREACRLAVQIGKYLMATIYLSDATNREPIICRAVSFRRSESKRPYREPLDGDGPVGRAMTSGELVVVPDIGDTSVAIPEREKLLSMGLRSCIALPLMIDGTPIGVFLLHADDHNAFGDAELALLQQVTGNITFSLQYLDSKESVEYLEYFDTLTALANRTLYLQRLASAIRSNERVNQALSLLVFDIAGLTVINDGLGHHAGDLVLQLVAERLKNVFQDSNVLSHLGGGRYGVFSSYAAGDREATTVLRERVQFLFDGPFKVGEQELRLSARAGFAEFPADGTDAEVLLQCAQTALDHAKRSGEMFERHRPDMNMAASERLSMTTRLRETAALQQFALHYQPRIRLTDNAVEGVEALLRWPGADVSPGVFVPLLESIGLIDVVGKWVLGRAMTESDKWLADVRTGAFRVAVNISALQLRRDRFAEEVLEAVAVFHDGTRRLELEITESVLMADLRRATDMLGRLREHGITIAIDDFGTGHSSLQILSRLPVDTLKIDRSFVRDIVTNERYRLLVQTTIQLAKSFGLSTVAEGVETEEQSAILAELGCDAIQGYLVLRPVAPEDFGAWLASRASAT